MAIQHVMYVCVETKSTKIDSEERKKFNALFQNGIKKTVS
jgi:hypothetical protein